MLTEDGQVLTWFGRDPEYEGKMLEWTSAGKEGKEPEKFHFVKGFERGLELFGQHCFSDDGFRERVRATGLFIMPGPNDVIALDALGGCAVGLCGTTVTSEQMEKLAAFVREMKSVVTVLFDCDEPGELAARVAVVELAQCCPVRLAWSPQMHGGTFKGREPNSLTPEEWQAIRRFLLEGSYSPSQ